jgi:hypothetical protein
MTVSERAGSSGHVLPLAAPHVFHFSNFGVHFMAKEPLNQHQSKK